MAQSKLIETQSSKKSEEEIAAWLIYELRKKGYTLQKIADREGVTRSAVSMSLRKPTKHLGMAICQILGLPFERIWPNHRVSQRGK